MQQIFFTHRKNIGGLSACFVCAALLLGCGDGRPRRVPVRGVITLDGKSEWPAVGSMYFIPTSSAKGFPQRPGSADFDRHGNFMARTFEPGDGLFPGTYQVQINCWKQRPTMEKTRGESFLPQRYRNAVTSGIELTVAADQNHCEFNFDVASK